MAQIDSADSVAIGVMDLEKNQDTEDEENDEDELVLILHQVAHNNPGSLPSIIAQPGIVVVSTNKSKTQSQLLDVNRFLTASGPGIDQYRQ